MLGDESVNYTSIPVSIFMLWVLLGCEKLVWNPYLPDLQWCVKQCSLDFFFFFFFISSQISGKLLI